MKKFLCLSAALACCVGLTACGETEMTSLEKQKVMMAEQVATEYVIPVLSDFMDDTLSVSSFDGYTMEEVGFIVQNYYTQVETDGYGFITAANSFTSAKEDMGAIVSVGQPTAVINDRQIVVTVDVQGAKRAGQAELIFSNDMFMVFESGAMNPSFTFKEKMAKAGLNTVIGISTVFIMLIIISFIIGAFRFVGPMEKAMAESKAKRKAKKEAKKAAKNAAITGIDNAVEQITKQETIEQENLADDTELVAVIAAAIAAYEGSGSTDGFVVRSIRKVRR